MRNRVLGLAAVLGALGLGAVPASAATTPFDHACSTYPDGVRFCPTTDAGPGQTVDGVPSFDGVPLDVDVTLPPVSDGPGPYPTIVMLHGYGNDKTSFESTSPQGDGSITYHYNNDYYAEQGYAVVNYTARGFGHSCGGGPAGYHSGPCGQGYIRLADTRYEARDTQYLVGLLVDQGFSKPGQIGVTGISYGGGQSMELAFLRDRIRLPDGSFVPWVTPSGTPLSITAAWPRWPWSDLVDALLPNGRFLDTQVAPPGQSLNPVGIELQSYVSGLYALGKSTGYYCGDAPASAPCTNPDADLTGDFALVNLGEPPSPGAVARLKEIYAHHQAYGLPGTPSPLLIENGWTDDLFPPEHAIRVYNAVRGANPAATVNLQFGDLGHSRGSNKRTVNQPFNDQGAAFLAYFVHGAGSAPPPGRITAYTQTCGAPDGGPYVAPRYSRLATGRLRFGSAATQTVTAVGNPVTSQQFDPITGTTDACKTIPAQSAPGTAVYTRTSPGFTMLGLPTVTATINTVGDFGELDSLLFDVSADGSTERLISRGAYRLTDNQSGQLTFQLHGNGYYFPAGDQVKLELLGRDAPYLRASNDLLFTVNVSNATVTLPTH